jgi:hypothetical protein
MQPSHFSGLAVSFLNGELVSESNGTRKINPGSITGFVAAGTGILADALARTLAAGAARYPCIRDTLTIYIVEG